MRKVDPALIPHLLEETAKAQLPTPYFSISELEENIRKLSASGSYGSNRLILCVELLRTRVSKERFREVTKDIPFVSD